MAQVNHVTTCITFAFFSLINFQVSKSIGYRNFGSSQVGNCRWIQQDGFGIDLSPLENYTTKLGFITYADKQVLYLFHPCSDIPLKSANTTECENGCSLCFFKAQNEKQSQLDIFSVLNGTVEGQFYRLALAGNAVFQPWESEMHLVYKNNNLSTTINLVCNNANDAKTTLQVKDPKAPVNIYNHSLILNSPYSCFRDLSHKRHYLSGWAVFFLIVMTIAAAYFFGGMLVLRNIKGATGTEMIPNYDFWVSLPGRIKNCFLRMIRRDSQGPDSYERI